MLNIEQVRLETPAVNGLLHFNNAGASLMPQQVFLALKNVLELEQEWGGYEAERRISGDVQAFYTEFASLLNAYPSEIAFVENATRAWDMAFYALPLKAGDRVITHGSEYASNYLAFLHLAKKRGIEIDIAPSDEYGQIDVDAIASLIRPATKLIAITHVPTQGGLVNPAAAVGRIAREHGLIYLLDACQSVGQLRVDVKEIGCDFLSGTGRKFLRGPRGTGFLYVSQKIVERLDPPFIDLLSATWVQDDRYELAAGAKRFENWESYVGGRVGLMTAVRYARSIGIEAIEERVVSLGAELRSALGAERGIQLHDQGQTKCGIVTFTKASIEPAELAEKLRGLKVNVSVSTLPYARLDLGARGLNSIVRASVHYFNTSDEIDRFVRLVASL